MGNCVSDSTGKFVEADDGKITRSGGSSEVRGLMEQRINVRYVSNGDNVNNRSASHTNYVNGCPRRSLPFPDNQQFMCGQGMSENKRIIVMPNPKFSHCERKPCKPAKSDFRRNIAAVSDERRAGGRGNVHRLKVVISAKELCELLINSESAAHNSREGALASLVLEKLSERCGNGGVMRMDSASISARSAVQGKGKKDDNNNNRSWRPSLEDIPELFTEE